VRRSQVRPAMTKPFLQAGPHTLDKFSRRIFVVLADEFRQQRGHLVSRGGPAIASKREPPSEPPRKVSS